ncbi:MAG: sigma-70 family RNA polymerase sigma factor [Gemmatimonas sp.]
MNHSPSVTSLLQRAAEGDQPAFEQAFELVYNELQHLAHAQLRRELEGHTLNTGALVHEAYLKLERGLPTGLDRAHFLAIAATAMRRVLVDHARRFHAEKRGGVNHAVAIESMDELPGAMRDARLIDLDEALARLATLDERQARVVECRFFGGLTENETADALSIGLRTVKRDWAKARSWLYRELYPDAVA